MKNFLINNYSSTTEALMSKFSTMITLMLLTVLLTGNLNGQEQERWSTKLLPNENAVKTNNEYDPDFKVNTEPMKQAAGKTTYTVYPNIMLHPTNGTGSQSEMSIAINPVNPNIILGGSNGANTAVTYLNQGWYASTNGGTTWYGNDSLPLKPAGYYRSDPVVGFDLNGNMFFNTLEYSSSTGDVVTLKSTDNGLNWTKVATPNPGDGEDKNWMAIDHNASSPSANYIYTAWTEFLSSDPNYRKLEFSRSTDGGATFQAVFNMSGTGGYLHQGVNLTVNKSSEVLAAYTMYPTSTLTSSNVTFAKSTNAGVSFNAPVTIATAIRDIRGNLSKGGNSIRVNSFPQIAVDNSAGPYSGRIYVTWPARPNAGQAPDVYLSWSDDGGTAWSAPKRVNADSALTNRDQFFPSVDVDPSDGSVNIIYYDSRNFANNDSCEVYLSRSVNGGLTFDDIKISTQPFLPKSIPSLATGYMGDYIEVAAKNGVVWPIWNDNRTGQHQAYTAKVFFVMIDHDQLLSTENLAGPYTVTADITASQAIATAKVFWRRGTSGAYTETVMTQVGSTNSYTADIPGNGTSSVYEYYVYAEDAGGSSATLPADAPATVFSFEAATDLTAPVVTHTNLTDQLRENWPAMVSASATDNLDVDSVWVTYKIGFDGTSAAFGLNRISGSNYSGYFNIDTSMISVGDTMYYRIVAQDVAAAQNKGYYPSEINYVKFVFVPDTDMPVIAHITLRDQPLIRWPAEVKANVTDPQGIKSVSVEYMINNGSPLTFNLSNTSGNTWTGLFTTEAVVIGDSVAYKIKATDNSNAANVSYLPQDGYYKFKIIDTKGIVLVVNDDVSLDARVSEKGGETDLRSALGASSSLIISTLTNAGYTVDSTTWAAFDVSTLPGYDLVALSSGTRTTVMFDDLAKRTAIVNYNLAGGKVFVEGGEVGWFYRWSSATSDKDPLFRRTILRDSVWHSDLGTAVPIRKRMPDHQIFGFPNAISDPITTTGTGVGQRDAMRTMLNDPGIFKVASWEGTYADTASIIAYSPTADTGYITNIFCTFAVSCIADPVQASKLLENLFEYLSFGDTFIPVELVSFNAAAGEKGVSLSWQTATEVNNAGFEIERKSNGSAFEKIGFVPGMGTTTRASQYNFVDDNITSGTFTYRLKQMDYDGTTSYSSEVNVEVTTPEMFELSQNYPNPFNPSTSIKFSIPKDGMVNLNVYNILGEKVAALINQEMKAGRYEAKFDASKMSSGLYIYRLDAGDASIVKKMMLLK
jgi:hypothetical protein